MTRRIQARCGNGHLGEAELPEDFDVEEMDVAESFPVPYICARCADPLVIIPGRYEPVEGVLAWMRPLQVD
jgi:hypothetical protein